MLYILLKHTHYTQRHTLNGNIEKRERLFGLKVYNIDMNYPLSLYLFFSKNMLGWSHLA